MSGINDFLTAAPDALRAGVDEETLAKLLAGQFVLTPKDPESGADETDAQDSGKS